jgi:phosphoenolpyruvate---glycerone phosphotransferase subunit DhaK
MKKFMNDPRNVLAESLRGFAAVHSDLVVVDFEKRFVRRKSLKQGKVALVSGGGAGHEPLHLGFVGEGMLDAACIGQIFTSPTPDQIVAAARAVDTGSGIVFIIKNYEGDRMNFQLARDMCGLDIHTVVVADDVATANSAMGIGGRGVAGTVVMHKILGAAAEEGLGVQELQALAQRLCSSMRSMGAALASGTVPEVGRPTFVLPENEIELGVGLHGEAGRQRVQWLGAAELAGKMVETIGADLPRRGDALVLVNGFGSTPLIELYLMYDAFAAELLRLGIRPVRRLVGSFATSLDMAGCSLTVALLEDDLFRLWDSPAHTATMRW